MTTAALLQATSIVTNTIIGAAMTSAGTPGGVFDTTPTTTIISIFNSDGVAVGNFASEFRAIVSSALVATGSASPAFEGQTIATGTVAGALLAQGVAVLDLFGADGAIPPAPPPIIPVRFTSGRHINVVPVEIVDQAAPNALEVTLWNGQGNYMPIVVRPFHPRRKRIHFVD